MSSKAYNRNFDLKTFTPLAWMSYTLVVPVALAHTMGYHLAKLGGGR